MNRFARLVLLVNKVGSDLYDVATWRQIRELIEIKCGKRTCASKPGEFCQFIGSKKFGQQHVCMLFDCELFGDSGWLMRDEQCMHLIGGGNDATKAKADRRASDR